MAKWGSYMSYELAFKGVKSDLPKMHTSDAICSFLHGLSTLLKSTCAVQPVSNKDWDDIDALMLFAKGEAIRLEMNKPATAPHADVNAALAVKNKHISKLRKQLKKTKSPTAAAALARLAFGVKSTAAAALNADTRPSRGKRELQATGGAGGQYTISYDGGATKRLTNEAEKRYIRNHGWCPKSGEQGHADYQRGDASVQCPNKRYCLLQSSVICWWYIGLLYF